MKVDKRQIQRKRMMLYFIEAADKIIEKEGIEGITIRKVADLAGYNSATIYNYFENIDHLIFFAAMKFIKDYVQEVPNYIEDAKDALDKYLLIWECFCKYSYTKPEVYYAIFFAKLDNSLEAYIKQYYEMFPNDLGNQPKELLPMLLKHDIYKRAMAVLEACVDEGFIKREDMVEVNEMILLIYQGMLSRIINKQVNYTVEQSVSRTMKYIKQTIKAYSPDGEL